MQKNVLHFGFQNVEVRMGINLACLRVAYIKASSGEVRGSRWSVLWSLRVAVLKCAVWRHEMQSVFS